MEKKNSRQPEEGTLTQNNSAICISQPIDFCVTPTKKTTGGRADLKQKMDQ